VSFLVGDGVMPANDGRGYVLRRLIRRAARKGNLLGIDRPFLYELVGPVADIMKDAYPEMLASAPYISKVCLSEEERFAFALSSGLRYFDQAVRETREEGGTTIGGDRLFKLYDTFGFPVDLSEELARERGLEVDGEGFARELEEQRRKARLTWKGDERQKERRAFDELKDLRVTSRVHEASELADVEVLAVLKEGLKASVLAAGDEGEVVLSETPFYAEAGGQVGDTGFLKGPGFSALVENTYYLTPELIASRVKVLAGELRPGQSVDATADIGRRQAVSDNHTATHLLHAALRQVLGDHVKQAGSLVSPVRLRFDFTHFAPLSPDELRRVESLVNEKIREDLPVETKVTTLEEGVREGATAIFEEKYGEKVRVVRIGEFSKELCGGVHVRSTGQIGIFKAVSESSIASGMRRIEAVTGEEGFRYLQELEDLMAAVEKGLGASRREVLAKIAKMKDAADALEKENKALRKKLAGGGSGGGEERAFEVKGIAVVVRKTDGLTMPELREAADALKQRMGSGVVVLGEVDGPKALLVVSVTKDLTARIQAGAVIKEAAPMIGGGGGGRPDFAQAGGGRPEGLDAALEAIPGVIERLVS
jgi:alanyl-tRNA synthetase